MTCQRSSDPEWVMIAVCSVMAAVLVYLASCGTAQAATAEIRFRNVADVPLTAIRITQGALPPTVVPVQCAALATCSATAQLAHGAHVTSIEAQAGGPAWSAPSNALSYRAIDPALCFADTVCRADFDGDGYVAGTDFSVFLTGFGKPW